MKALTNAYMESLAPEEMIICCNCSYIDTIEAYRGRCPNDRDYICANCGSKAFLIFDDETNKKFNLRDKEIILKEDDDFEE